MNHPMGREATADGAGRTATHGGGRYALSRAARCAAGAFDEIPRRVARDRKRRDASPRALLRRTRAATIHCAQARAHAADDALSQLLRKSGRQVVHDFAYSGLLHLQEFVEDSLDEGRGNAALCGGLHEVPRHDFIDDIMPVVADRKGELHVVPAELAGIEGGLN